MLIYVELLDFLILRERRHFWNSRPSMVLILIIAGDLVLVFFISVLGLPGIVPINPLVALTLLGLSFIIPFLINDLIYKTMLAEIISSPLQSCSHSIVCLRQRGRESGNETILGEKGIA
jgi:hypothetical protein